MKYVSFCEVVAVGTIFGNHNQTSFESCLHMFDMMCDVTESTYSLEYFCMIFNFLCDY